MTRSNTLMLAGLLAGSALLAPSASAQVSSVAVIEPAAAILNAKAIGAALQTIQTTYKTQFDQVSARSQAIVTELKTIVGPIDTNKDGQLSDAERAAAETAKNPALQRLATAQQTGQAEIDRLREPMVKAEIYAIEEVMKRYGEATQNVATNKKIQLVVSAEAVAWAQPGTSADITNDVKNEIDRLAPTVGIAPPAAWQPSQQGIQLFQQFEQARAAAAQQRAAGAPAPAAPAGAAPAAPRPASQGR